MNKLSEVIVSSDKNKLDIPFIHQFLTNSYWAKGRTIEEVKKSIQHSICFGVYKNGQQIGFARVLTDRVVFAYLMDVFIDESYRGNGYAQLLLTTIFDYKNLSELQWLLKTKDAHSLYQKFGFKPLEDPNKVMHRVA